MSIAKNSMYNIAGAIIPLIVSLITIPIYLDAIGDARYGVLAIAWLLLGYFGVFDLGLGRATAQRIGSLHKGTVSQRATAFWSALIVNFAIGILGGLVIWPVSYYVFGSTLSIESNLRHEVLSILPWLTFFVPFTTLSGVLTGALIGRERFLELNVISVCGSVLFQILPLLAVFIWEPTLNAIMPALLLSKAIALLMLFRYCLRHICQSHQIVFKKAEAIRLLQFGGWVTVSSIVGPIMVILDRFVIGIISGAAAVTLYTVPFQLGTRTTIVARSVSNAMFPQLSGLQEVEREEMARKGQSILISILTPLFIPAIFLIKPFLEIWISPEFAKASGVLGIIIFAGFWANSCAIIPYALLQARGRPDLVAKLLIVETLPYLFLLYLGLKFMGLPGAAIAFSVRATADALLLSWLAGQFWGTMTVIFMPSILISTSMFIAIKFEPGGIIWYALITSLIALSLTLAWRTTSRSDPQLADNLLNKIKLWK